MATTTGTIRDINVTDDIGCITVNRSGGGSSSLLLWSYITQDDNARNRFTHGMFLSLARDAYIHSKSVSFDHPSGSALVTNVKVL